MTSKTYDDVAQTQNRLTAISSYLIPTTPPTTMSAQRPFITCHVLDTTTGKPGASIAVTLKLVSPSLSQTTSAPYWTAITNSDGRVPSWTSSVEINDVVSRIKQDLKAGQQMIWSLTFDTEPYFGEGNTFWPEVELRFAAKREEEHYHVPLLLGPWSYTTYRGS